jgi:hypothetical protein
MDAPTDPAKLRAVLERLEAEEARRRAEKVEAGELVSIPLFIVAGSEAEARLRVEEAKATKLAELHAGGDQREVVFAVTTVKTGVVRCGEIADPASVPTAPSFLPAVNPMPRAASAPDDIQSYSLGTIRSKTDQEPQPPLIETYIAVQTRACRDDGDAGEICEAWFSVDAGTLTLTGTDGKHITSRAITAGEDPKTLAKQLLREKKQPSDFNRQIDYPSAGLA